MQKSRDSFCILTFEFVSLVSVVKLPVQHPWFQLFVIGPLRSCLVSLSIRNESRPASLVMAVTDF